MKSVSVTYCVLSRSFHEECWFFFFGFGFGFGFLVFMLRLSRPFRVTGVHFVLLLSSM